MLSVKSLGKLALGLSLVSTILGMAAFKLGTREEIVQENKRKVIDDGFEERIRRLEQLVEQNIEK